MSLPTPKFAGIEDALLFFIQTMDLEMIELVLEDGKTYQSLNKKDFMYRLSICFSFFKEKGDTNLNAIKGQCKKCNKGLSGYLFIGNHSKNYLSLLFEIEEKKIFDLGECLEFNTQFKHNNLNKRVYLDEWHFNFFNTTK